MHGVTEVDPPYLPPATFLSESAPAIEVVLSRFGQYGEAGMSFLVLVGVVFVPINVPSL